MFEYIIINIFQNSEIQFLSNLEYNSVSIPPTLFGIKNVDQYPIILYIFIIHKNDEFFRSKIIKNKSVYFGKCLFTRLTSGNFLKP